MNAGELRCRVSIQQKVALRGRDGGEVPQWGTVATVWAAVEPMLGREFVEGRQLTAEVTTRIRVRYRAGLTPEMRVVHGDDIYEVVAVQHVRNERREIVLMCREVL